MKTRSCSTACFTKVDLRRYANRALLFLPADEVASIHRMYAAWGRCWNHRPTSAKFCRSRTNRTPCRSRGRLLSLHMLLIEAQSPRREPQAWRRAQRRRSAVLHAVLRHHSRGPRHAHRPRRLSQSVGQPHDAAAAQTRPTRRADVLLQRRSGRRSAHSRPQRRSTRLSAGAATQGKGSFTAALSSVNEMRRIIGEARGAYPDLEFGLTGMPVLENGRDGRGRA